MKNEPGNFRLRLIFPFLAVHLASFTRHLFKRRFRKFTQQVRAPAAKSFVHGFALYKSSRVCIKPAPAPPGAAGIIGAPHVTPFNAGGDYHIAHGYALNFHDLLFPVYGLRCGYGAHAIFAPPLHQPRLSLASGNSQRLISSNAYPAKYLPRTQSSRSPKS